MPYPTTVKRLALLCVSFGLFGLRDFQIGLRPIGRFRTDSIPARQLLPCFLPPTLLHILMFKSHRRVGHMLGPAGQIGQSHSDSSRPAAAFIPQPPGHDEVSSSGSVLERAAT